MSTFVGKLSPQSFCPSIIYAVRIILCISLWNIDVQIRARWENPTPKQMTACNVMGNLGSNNVRYNKNVTLILYVKRREIPIKCMDL